MGKIILFIKKILKWGIIGFILLIVLALLIAPKTDKKEVKEKITKKVEIQGKDSAYSKVDDNICTISYFDYNVNSINGIINCGEGKLIINFYDKENHSLTDTKSVYFNNREFQFDLNHNQEMDVKFEIKLTKEQINSRTKEQIDSRKEEIISDKQEISKNNKISEINANQCQIENWQFSRQSKAYFVVDGTTSCDKGKIVIQFYDENNTYLGNEFAYINAGTFKTYFKTNSNLTNLQIKYKITN